MNDINKKNDEMFYLTDYEIKVMTALCSTSVKFKMNIIFSTFKRDNFNSIFKVSDNEWGISFIDSDEIEKFDDVVAACYTLIKGIVMPELLDYVLNYFNTELNNDIIDSSFLEFVNVKKRKKS